MSVYTLSELCLMVSYYYKYRPAEFLKFTQYFIDEITESYKHKAIRFPEVYKLLTIINELENKTIRRMKK